MNVLHYNSNTTKILSFASKLLYDKTIFADGPLYIEITTGSYDSKLRPPVVWLKVEF